MEKNKKEKEQRKIYRHKATGFLCLENYVKLQPKDKRKEFELVKTNKFLDNKLTTN